jgi:hypothetical protein
VQQTKTRVRDDLFNRRRFRNGIAGAAARPGAGRRPRA